MVYPSITAITAGVLVFLQMALMALTIKSRYKHQQGLGDGGNAELLAYIRSHANLTENAPIVLIVLGLLEMAGSSQLLVAALATLFVIARLLHPIGLLRTDGISRPRFFGVVLTIMVALTSSLFLILTAAERIS